MNNQKAALEIAAGIEARLNKGSDEYGNGQISSKLIYEDRRDWLQEAFEEALDLVFYLWAAIKRRDMEAQVEQEYYSGNQSAQFTARVPQPNGSVDLQTIRGSSTE